MIIYKITNTQNNKSYIGFTKHSIDIRWKQHVNRSFRNNKNIKFDNAIRLYGIECWTKEIICEVNTRKEAEEKEIYYIEFYDTYHSGYNSTKGGDGNNNIVMSEESNRARSEKLRGIAKSNSTIKKFRERRQTEQTKEKIAKAHLGMKKPWVKWTEEQIKQRGMTRRKLTKEQYDTINTLRSQNMIITDIAKHVSLSPALVKKWLKLEW